MTILGLLTAFPDVGGGGTLSSESVNVTLNVTEAIHTLSVPQDVRDVYVVTYLLSFFFCFLLFLLQPPPPPLGLAFQNHGQLADTTIATITTTASASVLVPFLLSSCSATIANSGFFYTTLKTNLGD